MNEPQAPTGPAGSAGGPPKSTADEPWPVRVVSQKVGAWIARLGWVWVDGQVAQISRRAGSGVVFLTLRDPSADLSLTVTAHRDVLEAGAPDLSEGARVTLHAKPEFYPARGTLSLRADEIRQVGLGELLARLERLKKLLAAEGLFARERKRRLPFLPTRIGLITGQNTAAERDVLMNVRRRWPGAAFRTAHVTVQGPNAVPQILNALKVLDDDETVDVIVIARGGGSVEDLLPFSDEALCRAVFAARTPVVSAIGHETDTPLLDYVADLRASTPTDAAKRIVPDLADELRLIEHARQRLDRAVLTLIDRERHRIEAWRSRPVLARPQTLIDQRSTEVAALRERAGRSLEHRVRRADDELRHTLARLRALSPLATLQRGYAIVQRADGHVVRAAGEVVPGDPLRIRVAEGELTAVVTAGEGE
ncbi:exodeoxyribonuclease VII large subunit [Actinoplanes teichomyceticus]|uniref:Exodeoxyribonuclease 7 large subunit n=1 Tax=Actinoplanes teichomyceticus TaxID=1867 RepID=A0A561WPH4_ACTTI|nr:exodeoxyribonuclease VII large subunit [Actinoplanes teichomyceticus]TWG25774.1 exodeoxyribonuclease VII large subunit [Actinoplanes teichomyceticus]GIF10849.1 exodeoxyribonuclease 7 large subunit [Actinoplanes teichomyceticus]